MTKSNKRASREVCREALVEAVTLDAMLEGWALGRRLSLEASNDAKARLIELTPEYSDGGESDVLSSVPGLSTAKLVQELCSGVHQRQVEAVRSSCAFLTRPWWVDGKGDRATA